jgi:hypothetical protein
VRARLFRYGAWQLRDYVFERGLPSLIVAALLFLPVMAQYQAGRRMPGFRPDIFARTTLGAVAPVFALFVVLLAVNGIISNDRKTGTYRLLFAKPLSIGRFYAQTFVLHWVGALLVTAVVLVAYALLLHPVAPAGLLSFVSLCYLALGGLGFLYSALARLDWTLMAATWGVAVLLRNVFPRDESWYGRALDLVLPPLHRISDVGTALVTGQPVTGSTIAWLATYGAAGFALGLFVLRVRPMGE